MKTFAILLLSTLTSFSVKAKQEKILLLPEPAKTIDDRITNGYPAKEGDIPYIVGLSFRVEGWLLRCGGSIISNNFVLTAAHCTNGKDNVIIYYGSSTETKAQFTHKVDKSDFIPHQDYSHITENDIALIRTPHISFSDLVNKIDLPRINDRYNSYANSWAKACGWGYTHDSSVFSDNLNCVDLEIIENSVCQKYIYGIKDHVLCVATPNGKNTCNGDSGGPLVSHDDNLLVGITSFGSFDCQDGIPGGFTRVTSYLNWIRDNSGIAYY